MGCPRRRGGSDALSSWLCSCASALLCCNCGKYSACNAGAALLDVHAVAAAAVTVAAVAVAAIAAAFAAVCASTARSIVCFPVGWQGLLLVELLHGQSCWQQALLLLPAFAAEPRDVLPADASTAVWAGQLVPPPPVALPGQPLARMALRDVPVLQLLQPTAGFHTAICKISANSLQKRGALLCLPAGLAA